MAVGVVVVAERVEPAHHGVEGPVDGEGPDVPFQVCDGVRGELRIGARLLQVGRRQVDARHHHARRGQPPGDAPVATGRVEDRVSRAADRAARGSPRCRRPSARRRSTPRRSRGSRRRRWPPCRTSCAIIAAGRVARMREPEDLSFDAATAVQQTGDPALFEADIHHLWTVGDKPNGGYLLALLGRAARIIASRRRQPGLGGPVLLHHLPAAARARPGHRADDAAPQRAYGRPRAGRPRPGRGRSGGRRVRARRPSRGARHPLRRHRALPRAGPRGVRAPHPEDPDRRLCRDHGRARPPARPGHAPLRRLSPAGRHAGRSCAAGHASPTAGSPTPCRCSSSPTPSRRPRS